MGIGWGFQVGGSRFLKGFSEGFFSEKMSKMKPKITSKISQNLIKNELETKSTKHVGNVQHFIPLDLQETRFEWKDFKRSLKAEVRTSLKQN